MENTKTEKQYDIDFLELEHLVRDAKLLIV